MRYVIWGFFLFGMSVGAQEAPRVTGDEWVVIFAVKRDNIAKDPYLEIRTIVKADTEGEAALAASKALNRILSASAYEALKFIEAQARQRR